MTVTEHPDHIADHTDHIADRAVARRHPAGQASRAARLARPPEAGRVTVLPTRAPAVAGDARPDGATAVVLPIDRAHAHPADEDGSLVAEYGLLAVVAATIAGVLISWASGGAVAGFFDALLSSARDLVGA